MTLTGRDKKIALVLVPLVVIVGYWFLLLAPKRQEATKASDAAQKQEQRLDSARAQLDELQASKNSFATDFAQMVRLGKAVPTSVDMPSLMVQLESAAKGTGISFTNIKSGQRQAAASGSGSSSSSGGSSGSSPSSGNGSPPVAAGGAQTQSAPGGAVQSANNTKQKADQKSASDEKSGVSSSDTQTSTSSKSGGLPVGGGSTAAGGATGGASSVPGLDSVPLELEFEGNFLKLADFFHSLKRFVRVASRRVRVQGRLMTVESLNFSTDAELFPKVKAELTATVYLTPASEGKTAGASPQGPGAVPAASPGGSAPASPTPTATAAP